MPPFDSGNEFSYFMLMVSNFMLNGIGEVSSELMVTAPIEAEILHVNIFCLTDLVDTYWKFFGILLAG